MLKKVKRLLFLILAFFSFNLNFSNYYVKASTVEYLRVLSNEAYIYDNANLSNKIFKVPYGYYVKVESVNADYVRVTYGDDGNEYPVIMGYMNKSDLTTITTPPTKPFSVIKVSTANSDILFNDVNLKKAYFNVPVDTFMYFYGDCNTETSNLSYVYCKNKLGYIDTSCLNPFTIPNSPDEIITSTPESAPPTDKNEEQSTSEPQTTTIGENLQIIIIVGISVISVSVVYFLFKPTKTKISDDEQEE